MTNIWQAILNSDIVSMITRYNVVIWATWLLIPLLMEIIPSVVNFILLIFKKVGKKKDKRIEFYPVVSILIPVYNSSQSLERCLKSINDSTYPKESIDIILINNKSRDDSFEIYKNCQNNYPGLKMKWLNSDQGKSRALNLALYNSTGKYIINIDSDGILEENALMNIVKRFESNDDISCLTGVILTNPDLIKETKNPVLKLVRKLEYVEYCQAFLAGRNYESETNSIFTLSGAFSSFRKSTILKTQMYNTDTICEDTQLTFQVKNNLNGRVALCENAIYITDPIDDLAKMYTQRQRWQIGELEVFHMFYNKKKLNLYRFFTDKNIRTLAYDHTFAFPRFIWYFAMLLLGFVKYDMGIIAMVVGIMYLLYTASSFLYYFAVVYYLKKFKKYKKYYASKILYLFIFPLYNFYIFTIRFLGILNSIGKKSTWKTDNLKEEKQKIRKTIKEDFTGVTLRTKKKGVKRRFLYLLVVLIFVINMCATYVFIQNNENSKVTAYKIGEDKVLDSLVDGAGTVYSENAFYEYVKNADVLSNQLWFVYNPKSEKFINYDNRLGISTGFIVSNLDHNFKTEVVQIESESMHYLLNAREIKFNDDTFHVGIITSKLYILNSIETELSKEFIMFEAFCLQFLVLVFIALFIDSKNKNEEIKIGVGNRNNTSELIINTDNDVEISNMVTPAIFFRTIGKIKEGNKFKYEIYKCYIQNKKVLKLLNSKNILISSNNNNTYYILMVNMDDDERDKIMSRISNNHLISYEMCSPSQVVF